MVEAPLFCGGAGTFIGGLGQRSDVSRPRPRSSSRRLEILRSGASPTEDLPSPASPRRQPRDAAAAVAVADRQASRAQRRAEVERELCDKLGLSLEQDGAPGTIAEADGRLAVEVCAAAPRVESLRYAPRHQYTPRDKVSAEGLYETLVRPRSALRRGTGLAAETAGPSRPPKPKPHRALATSYEDAGGMSAPTSAEALPTVRRWKSALAPLWPDRGVPEASPRLDLSKTAPACLLTAAEIAAVAKAEEADWSSRSGLELVAFSECGPVPAAPGFGLCLWLSSL
ncbi:unnamed protein product [Polarella glacialis]|uniref:Uncharacterized protein n=1 Tax=Polarella glacialis TaxID=89957 RepID=A0A813DCV7_POLGL|nr:unnamed protein product [Polarella glacialis]